MLITQRLRIRPLATADAPFILRLLNDPGFLEHIGDKGVRTIRDAESYISDGPLHSREQHGFALDLVELADGSSIGICGLLKRPVLRNEDVGYAFLPEYRRQGYATEAVRAVLEDARERLKLRRVAAVVSEGNTRSTALLERLGFRMEGRTRLQPEQPEVLLYVVGLD